MQYTLFYSRLRPLSPEREADYRRKSDQLLERAQREFPGFVDAKTFVAEDGERLTIVRFEDADSQRAWASDGEHRAAQQRGRDDFYAEYRSVVCEDVREQSWSQQRPASECADRGDAQRTNTDEPFPETLDPNDWDEYQELAHEMVDTMVDWLRTIRERPAWQPVPDSVHQRLREPVPAEGMGERAAWNEFRELVLPYPTGLSSPRWWGWAGGVGSPMGILASFLGAATNSVPGNFDDAASRVEEQVLDWMKQAMGFPADASGLVTTGGSEGNWAGLAVARQRAFEKLGVDSVDRVGSPLVFYASEEVHSSMNKAARLLGLGPGAVHSIGVDELARIRVDELRERIAQDRREGSIPFAIIGTAGTINTGGMDDLDALADLAAEEELWFHVDGAFGALAALSPEVRDRVRGMERADSVAFDFHKWMSVNYEAGCVLVRDAALHRRTFAGGGTYLAAQARGTGSQADKAADRGIQLSRGFKALKPWMMIKAYGLERFGRLVTQNVRQAEALAELIDASDLLDRARPVTLNIVAFRHENPGRSGEELDAINGELLMRIQERGIAIPSSTRIDGRLTLRACFCNHRTRRHDLDEFVHEAENVLREILAQHSGSAMGRA